jgi:O-antigen/teichoic acid export membrane protein
MTPRSSPCLVEERTLQTLEPVPVRGRIIDAVTNGTTPAARAAPAALIRSLATRSEYVVVMALASALGLIKNIVYAVVLGPEALGLYGLVLLVNEYGLHLTHWALLNGLNTELPERYGRRDRDADDMVRRTFGALLMTATITVGVYAMIVVTVSDGDARFVLLAGAVLTVLTLVAEFCALVLRSRQQVRAMARTYLLRVSVALVLGTVGGALAGVKATVALEVVALVLALSVFLLVWLPDVRPRRPQLAETRRLMRTGLPLMISAILVGATLTVDRLLVAARLPDEFGQYVFASYVVIACAATAAMLNSAIAPRLLYELGAGASLAELRAEVRSIALRVIIAGGIGFVLLWMATQAASRGPLEQYAIGLEAMRVLYVGGVMMVLAGVGGWLLVAARRLALVAGINAVLAFGAVGAGVLVALGSPAVIDFAWIFTGSQFAAAAIISIAAERAVRSAAP